MYQSKPICNVQQIASSKTRPTIKSSHRYNNSSRTYTLEHATPSPPCIAVTLKQPRSLGIAAKGLVYIAVEAWARIDCVIRVTGSEGSRTSLYSCRMIFFSVGSLSWYLVRKNECRDGAAACISGINHSSGVYSSAAWFMRTMWFIVGWAGAFYGGRRGVWGIGGEWRKLRMENMGGHEFT